jgi:hypothetical protein
MELTIHLCQPFSLEKTLRNFSCLTTGDSIMVAYNNKKYYIDIVETKPSHAISIIETDCEVDFAPPLDYKEPEKPKSVVHPTAAPTAGDTHVMLSVVACDYFSPFCFVRILILFDCFIIVKQMSILQRPLLKNQSSLPSLVQEDVWMENLLKIRTC